MATEEDSGMITATQSLIDKLVRRRTGTESLIVRCMTANSGEARSMQ